MIEFEQELKGIIEARSRKRLVETEKPEVKDPFEGLDDVVEELLTSLGNSEWGEGKYSYDPQTWTLNGPPFSEPIFEPGRKSTHKFYKLSKGKNDEGHYIFANHSFRIAPPTILENNPYIDFLSNKRSRGGIVIIRHPFTKESLSGLVRAAALLGPENDWTSTAGGVGRAGTGFGHNVF